MKKIFFLFVVLVLFPGCATNSVDYSKLKELSDINENVLRDLYETILKPIIGTGYLSTLPSKPLLAESLLSADTSSNECFVYKQYEKFKHLDWSDVIDRDRMRSEAELKSILIKPDGSWEKFNKIYGSECVYHISFPIFSKDFKNVTVKINYSCGYIDGEGMIKRFSYINGRWYESASHTYLRS